jgi:DeoR family glycerol-3-phosphate regulon repressor
MTKSKVGRPPKAEERLELNARHEAIVALVAGENYVNINRLAEHFKLTPQTIRRDLRLLGESGRLARHHGGAAANASSTANIDYRERQGIQAAEKARIAAAAVAMVPDGASLFINIGTTTEAVAEALCNHRNLRVITNNLNVASRLIRRADMEVVIAGGLVRNADGGVVGDETAEFIDRFRVDFGVIGISAIDPADGTLLDYDAREVRVAQAIMRNARCVMLVADYSKFGRDSMVRMGSLQDVDVFCTDRPPPPAIAALLAEHGVRLVVAEPSARKMSVNEHIE